MHFNLDFSGILSTLIAIVLGGTGFIIATIGLIVGLVEKSKSNRQVFQQKAAAFIIGGLVQLGFSLFFFLPLLDDHRSGRSFREMMDMIAACSFLFIIGFAVTIIVVVIKRVSAKYYTTS